MDFSIRQIFDQSWDIVKKNLGLCMGLTFLMFLVAGTMKFLPLIGNLILVPFQLGYLRCLWQMQNGKEFDYPDFFWGWMDINRLGHVILLQALVTVFTIFGFLLLIIPGFWVMVATALAMPAFLFMTEPDALAAIKESMAMVKGRWWEVFGFLCVIGLILLVGAMVFGIGLLIACPLVALMLLNLTVKLQANKIPDSATGFAPIS